MVFQQELFNTGYILGSPLAVAGQEIIEFLKQNFLLQKYSGIALDPCVDIILAPACLETPLGCECVHLTKAELEEKTETLKQEMQFLNCISAQVGMLLSQLFLMAALPPIHSLSI